MTHADIAELERLLAAYRALMAKQPYARVPLGVGRVRAKLETALVRHADDLIAAAKARQPGVPHPFEPDPPMAEWPERRR